MAILKNADIKKMSKEERRAKLKELRFELVKSRVGSNKASAKTKEIKRAIARLMTINNSQRNSAKGGLSNK